MARGGQRQSGGRRPAPRNRRRAATSTTRASSPSSPARSARSRRPSSAARARSARTKFQVVALLVREERARVKADETSGEAPRTEQLKRLDGIATILAKTAARDTSLFALLAEDAVVSAAAEGAQARHAEARPASSRSPRNPSRRTPTPRPPPTSVGSCRSRWSSRQLANPFLAPDFSAPRAAQSGRRRLASWELLGPLFRVVRGRRRASSCMDAARADLPAGARRPGADAAPGASWSPRPPSGHRTFLLADEPGLGKTAQALLAAQAANAYPLLVVVPNVVKTNWAREAESVDPEPHGAPSIHGDGQDDRRLRRHRRRQLRGARPPRRLARRLRLPRHGRRRGALHQEQDLAALPARAGARRADPGQSARGRC